MMSTETVLVNIPQSIFTCGAETGRPCGAAGEFPSRFSRYRAHFPGGCGVGLPSSCVPLLFLLLVLPEIKPEPFERWVECGNACHLLLGQR